jgi:hypothetical protein
VCGPAFAPPVYWLPCILSTHTWIPIALCARSQSQTVTQVRGHTRIRTGVRTHHSSTYGRRQRLFHGVVRNGTHVRTTDVFNSPSLQEAMPGGAALARVGPSPKACCDLLHHGEGDAHARGHARDTHEAAAPQRQQPGVGVEWGGKTAGSGTHSQRHTKRNIKKVAATNTTASARWGPMQQPRPQQHGVAVVAEGSSGSGSGGSRSSSTYWQQQRQQQQEQQQQHGDGAVHSPFLSRYGRDALEHPSVLAGGAHFHLPRTTGRLISRAQ